MPRREIYIYYRVAPDHRSDLAEAVSTLQATLKGAHPRLVARLLRSADHAGSGRETWMETYARPDADVDAALQLEIESGALAFARLIDGERHVEIFVADD